MRVFLYVFCLFGVINNIYSQDTICFLNKTSQAVKVDEVGIEEIKYHRFSNLDGPLYVAGKKEIRYIKYANGHVDSMTVVSQPKSVASSQIISVHTLKTPVTNDGKIFINRDKLSYNGKAIGEIELLRIISGEPNAEKKLILLKEYDKMKAFRKKQHLFGFVGLGAGLLLPTIGFAVSNGTNDGGPFAIGFLAALSIGVPGAIISGIFKHQRTKQKIAVAKLYNN